MTEQLPNLLNIAFLATTIAAIIIYYFANGRALKSTVFIIVWSVFHAILAQQGFYKNTTSIPPRFLLILLPAILVISYGLTSKTLAVVAQKRNTKLATLLHTVRLPMELCLHGLFTYKLIPKIMTYEGLNFDIIMGITAPIIFFLLLRKKISNKQLLIWNILGLILILFIFLIGIFSAELPIQLLGLEQPNVAVTLFPFILLPATVVPIVIYMHASEIMLRIRKSSR